MTLKDIKPVDMNFPAVVSTGSGSEECYTVEARDISVTPISFGGQLFDNRWRRVRFEQSKIGIPSAPRYSQKTIEHGFLSYQAAQALRWWVIASAAVEGAYCLETRLVKHRIKFSHEITAIEAIEEADHNGIKK